MYIHSLQSEAKRNSFTNPLHIRKPFVLSNFLFYTTMFYYFLEVAFHKLDYVTSNDLQYIERVSLFLLSSFLIYVINIWAYR